MIRLILFLSLLNLFSVDSARILGVFPIPSISHQVVFRALTTELARRGHELVIITPDPALPKDRPRANVTEIDVSFAYQRLMAMMAEGAGKKIFQRGVIMGSKVHLMVGDPSKSLISVIVDIVEHPEVKKYTSDKNQKFDLVIAEAFMNYHFILSKIFNAPLIIFSSYHGYHESFEAIGAPTRHPILYPTILYEDHNPATLIDRLRHLKFEYDYKNAMRVQESYENEMLKKNYGPDAPTVEELRRNVDLFFINSNPVYCNNRPLPPNGVYVGPLHLQPLKELPQELKTFLDNSKNGVIYVSFGTNVRPSMMDKDYLEALIEAFRELSMYDILWKFDGENLENIPKNVKVQKWFPQRDLLVHPKIKLFVTQGGLQSTDEAIDAGVPLVGIPMLGDQYYNTHNYEKLGIGVQLDGLTLDKNSLLKGIKTVLSDESYRKNIQKIKKVINDQPQKPLERAVWWTEYVIRHGGAKHLRSPSATMTWPEYLMADVVVAVVAVAFAAVTLMCIAIRFIIGIVSKKPKLKKN